MTRVTVMAMAALLLISTGCQTQQQQQQQEPEETEQIEPKVLPPMHLGEVHQVYPEQGFALLRIIGPMPKIGAVLITHPADGSNDRIGNLIVSNEYTARGNIVTADIRSGSVMRTDRVFMYRSIVPKNETTEEEERVTAGEHPILDSVSEEQVAAARRKKAAEEAAAPAPTPAPVAEPEPIEEPMPETEDDTIPETAPVEVTEDTPAAPAPAVEVPSYLDEIPDDIHDWN